MHLTGEQKKAVEHPQTPLLVLAGPGSGKTTVLTQRCLWLIQQGIEPKKLFVATFTNKAANELKERLKHMIGSKAQEIYAGTFHSLCARWLRRNPKATGRSDWSIVDDREAVRIVRRVIRQGKFMVDEETAMTAIALAKAGLQGPEDMTDKAMAQVYEAYNEELGRLNAMDFGDLVAQFVKALRTDPKLLAKAQGEFEHVLVDEFQDINRAQNEAVRLLAERHRRITCVGDMDQAIFSFQGGCLEAIMKFREHWPDASVVGLTENFRSTQIIVEAASQLIRRNAASSGLQLWTKNEKGSPIRTRPFISELDEADWVAEEIDRLIHRKENPVDPKEIAVLIRVMAHALPIEQSLIQRRIPYEVIGVRPFMEYPEIREAIIYLKLLENPGDPVSFRQLMALHGAGFDLATRVLERSAACSMNPFDYIAYQMAFERYSSWEARKLMSVRGTYNRVAARAAVGLADVISELLNSSKVLAGLTNVQGEYAEAEVRLEQFARLASHFEASRKGTGTPLVSSFLSYLLDDEGEMNPDEPKVQVLSIHRAKGLEWSHVFVVGATADTLPHHQSVAERGDEGIDEERRLLYVALTRAKQEVTITWPLSRQRSTSHIEQTMPSPFINELPKECMQPLLSETAIR